MKKWGIPMTDLINILLLVPLVSILIYIIPVCYLDVRYREVNNWYWLPLLIVNVPTAVYLYVSVWYPWYCLLISLIIIGIFAFMVRIDFLNGADFIFLACIALFWIVNPHPLPHSIQIQFYLYLLISMLVTAAAVLCLNYLRGERKSWIAMMQEYPRGVPYILPVSFAFVLSYLLG
jgi:Flp pilus assembly protein protease CpaA